MTHDEAEDPDVIKMLSSLIGTLEKGKVADIVAVPGDLLNDIHSTESVLFVMKGGRI